MTLENEISDYNQFFFFKEFTYSNTWFKKRSETDIENEVELADSLLWIGDELVIYQLKERFSPNPTTPEKEKAWFEGKVLKKGTKQVRDTLGYLSDLVTIP